MVSSNYDLFNNSNFGLDFSSLKNASSQSGNLGVDLSSSFGTDYSKGFGESFYPTNAINGTGTLSQIPSWSDLAFGYKDASGAMHSGLASTGFDLLKSGLGFYLGSQQLKQAENTLAENQRQFNLNYNAQKDLINDQLAWQYQARKDRNANNAGTLTQIS